MAFKKRAINLRFTFADGSTAGDYLDLTGYRCEAVIKNQGGGMAMALMQLRVWGMKQSDMNRLSTAGINALAVRNNQITLDAGDEGGKIQQVFDGTILSAYIDYSSAPEVSFNVFAQSGGLYKAKPAAPTSIQGTVSAASVIESLAKSMGFAFINNGVTAQISNPYLDKTTFEQIEAIAHAANAICSIENKTITIWPNGGVRDQIVTEFSPSTGMVGYPTLTPYGIKLKAEFDPNISGGRKAKITSDLATASGEWYTHAVSHELSTLAPGGPWFTNISLSRSQLYVQWS